LLHYKRQYAESARHFSEAFRKEPGLATHRRLARFKAACAAMGATAGQSDAAGATAQQHAELRGQALSLLQQDVAAWQDEVRSQTVDFRNLRRKLRRWKWTPTLAGVREPGKLATLPEAEQQPWRQLWSDVDLLLKYGWSK
jgi:hypothetical protein